jgi:homoaconitase/3-isopropylmalate dehydratase large subunit
MAYYKAPVLIADTANLNDRIYTRDVILDIVRQFNARKTPMMGALIISPDYKEISCSGEISLFNMSHIVKSLKTSFDSNHSPLTNLVHYQNKSSYYF